MPMKREVSEIPFAATKPSEEITHLYRGSWIETWKEFPSAVKDLRNCNFDSLLKETGNNSHTSTMVSNASLYFHITESISSQHHLKTPSTPVTPVPSIMSLVRLNGTCQSWHVMSYDMKNEEHDNTI